MKFVVDLDVTADDGKPVSEEVMRLWLERYQLVPEDCSFELAENPEAYPDLEMSRDEGQYRRFIITRVAVKLL